MEENPTQNVTQSPNPVVVENLTIPPQDVQALNGYPPSSSTSSNTESHQNNVAKTLIAIFLLLFIYPIGLFFMWFTTKWPKWVKLLLTLLPLILIVVGIIVVFTTALMGSRNISKSTGANSSVYQVSPKPTIPVNTQGNRIINNDGGYSFMLPSPWKAKISSNSKTTTVFGETFLNDLGIGQIDVENNYISLADALSHQAKGQYSAPTPITVDGVSGVTENFISVAQGKVVILYKDGKTYGISILSNNLDDLSKFQEILSTFQFTDSHLADNSSDWVSETFNNLSFKYPAIYNAGSLCKELFFIDTLPIPKSCSFGDDTPGFMVRLISNETLSQAKQEFLARTGLINKTTSDITIDNHPALEAKGVLPPGEVAGNHNDWSTYISYGNDLYFFYSFDLHISSVDQQKYYDQILSTFKFTQ